MNIQQQYRRWVVLGLTLCLALVLPARASRAGDFKVESASTSVVDGQVVLDAHIDYRFSDAALEALGNGVPLIIEVQIEIEKDDAWPWERSVLDTRRRYRFRHHALAGTYQVEDLESASLLNFATREAAIRTLGTIRGLPLIEHAALQTGEHYTARIRAFLDIEALPLPLRPLAYLSPSWRLASDWLSWSLRP